MSDYTQTKFDCDYFISDIYDLFIALVVWDNIGIWNFLSHSRILGLFRIIQNGEAVNLTGNSNVVQIPI